MGFCKYGNTKVIGSGTYYICSVSNYPCKFARWCPTSLVYKPNANFNSCNIKIKQDRINLNATKVEKPSKIEDKDIQDVFVEEENILNDVLFSDNDTKEEEETFVPRKLSKRKKKASSL